VPTVVPHVSSSEGSAATSTFSNARTIARAGSSGVEGTFSISKRPSRTKTQSVNVPPVSIAIRMAAKFYINPAKNIYQGEKKEECRTNTFT
jgi:hypothetical protein